MYTLALQLVLCTLGAGEPGSLANLDFSAGTLAGWEGGGFAVQIASGADAGQAYAVSSRGTGSDGYKGALHRAFVVPADAAVIRFRAYADRGLLNRTEDSLEVLLLAAGKHIIPKRVRSAGGWKQSALLPAKDGKVQEYMWPVAAYAGKWVRIVLLDEDERPGCFVHCSGFEVLTQDKFETEELSRDVGLAGRSKLGPMTPYHSQHFTAFSNADEKFSENRLADCESIYTLFYDHFRRKGFALFTPSSKLLVSILDSEASFETFLGRKLPAQVTGIYQLQSNRLVMYDFGQNESFVSRTRDALKEGQRITLQMDRLRYLEGVQRQSRDIRADANIATIMHEVAHQLSFNSGMLNREADVPLWLAEGLACYCESTAGGAWQGIGEPNLSRIGTLAEALRMRTPLLSLRELIAADRAVQSGDPKRILLAYAQSWALLYMMLQEEPDRTRVYCKLIYPQRVSERRLADFQQAFGSDLARLEQRHAAYTKNLVQQYAPAKP